VVKPVLSRPRTLLGAFALAFVATVFVALSAMGPYAVYAASEPQTTPSSDGPVVVDTGVYVLNVGRLDTATGGYTVDFYLRFRCEAACDANEFEFSNGRATYVNQQNDLPTLKDFRVLAALNTNLDLRSYPFDKHRLAIGLEHKRLEADSLVYRADPAMNGLDADVIVSGWELIGWDARVTEHRYPVFDETYSRYEFSIEIQRAVLSAVLKALLPAFFIVLGGFMAFVIPPDKAVHRVAINTAALVGAVLFHVNLTSQVPPVGYLTYADKYMLVNYAGLLGALGVTVSLFLLEKKEAVANRVHRVGRVAVPVTWAALQLAALASI
jgi:hypothetical protein